MEIFKSTRHPEGRPAVVIRSREIRQPLTLAMFLLMLYIIVDILVGQFALADLLWGLVVAAVAATVLTYVRMRQHVSEVLVQTDYAAVRTLEDILAERPPAWGPIYDIRNQPDTLTLTIAWGSYDLAKEEWPDHEELVAALQQHRHRPASR